MSIFHDQSPYMWIEELKPGCFRLKLNYKDLDNSSFTSSEMISGKVHWIVRHSSAYLQCIYDPMCYLAFNSVEIVITSCNDYNKSFELSLLDKTGKTVVTVFPSGGSFYFPLNVMKVFLEDVAVVDGYFFVQFKISHPKTSLEKVSSLPEQLGDLLNRRECVDVTIEVKGELFGAHKFILGARSPVFKAELFGSMAEAKSSYIRIEDMEIEVFRSLLHYIYTDTLGGDHETISINMAQHLLVAADRYCVDGLKKICDEKLSNEVSLNSVLSSFAFAEQHNCVELKNTCLKFLTEPTNIAKLAFTEEYLQFMQNFPVLVAQLRKHTELASSKQAI